MVLKRCAFNFFQVPGSRFWILIRELQRDSIISIFSTCPMCRGDSLPVVFRRAGTR